MPARCAVSRALVRLCTERLQPLLRVANTRTALPLNSFLSITAGMKPGLPLFARLIAALCITKILVVFILNKVYSVPIMQLDRQNLYTDKRYAGPQQELKKAWATMFLETVESFLAGMDVMSSEEIKRAQEWRMPFFMCSVTLHKTNKDVEGRNLYEKYWAKTYSFSKEPEAQLFAAQCESLNLNDISLVATVIGRNRLNERDDGPRNRARS